MKNTKELIKLGLSEREAIIYLASLEIGRGGILNISKKSGLAKSTTHDVLKGLIKKGFIHPYVKGKRRIYSSVEPSVLKKKIESQKLLIDKILPELEAMYNVDARRPHVRFFEGEEGVQAVTTEILNEAKEMLAVASVDDAFTLLPQYFPKFSQERVARGIPARIIFRNTKMAHQRKSRDKKELRTSKIVDSKIPFYSMLFIWNNKVAIMTFKKEYSILVTEDHGTAQIIRAVVELAWDHAPEATKLPS